MLEGLARKKQSPPNPVKTKAQFESTADNRLVANIMLNPLCYACGQSIKPRSPSKFRHKRAFCSPQCYYSMRQDGKYVQWRQGQRRARKAVSEHFQLQPGNVVHHHDDDNRNNEIFNLAVFRNQSEHMAFHHGNPSAKPIWDGRAK